jgi:hypothetical protein
MDEKSLPGVKGHGRVRELPLRGSTKALMGSLQRCAGVLAPPRRGPALVTWEPRPIRAEGEEVR